MSLSTPNSCAMCAARAGGGGGDEAVDITECATAVQKKRWSLT
jgi:hypothetical protein